MAVLGAIVLWMSFFFLRATWCMKVEFPNPIKFPSCPQDLVGEWSVEGSVTMTPQDLTMHEPKVIIRTENEELCIIDLTTCGRLIPSPTSVDMCHCSSKKGNVHNLYIRRRPRSAQSGLMLHSIIPSSNVCVPTPNKFEIGLLQDVRDTPVTTFKMGDDDKFTAMMSVHNTTVIKNQYSRLQVCVSNLAAGSTLELGIGDQVTKTNSPCIDVIQKFDFSAAPFYQVKFRYEENSECSGIKSYALYIRENTRNLVRVTDREALQTAREILIPANTCTKHINSNPRELVTLSDGRQIVCDTETDGGNFVVIQRRNSSDVDFYRKWDEYVTGFGNKRGNFWMGLEPIHKYCNSEYTCELRIDLMFKGRKYHATYQKFSLSPSSENYALHVSAYSGDAGDVFTTRGNGQPFSTWDKDNDSYGDNCAVMYHGAWWYEKCHKSNLNGLWGNKEYAKGLTWFPLTGYYDTSTFSEMKVRVYH